MASPQKPELPSLLGALTRRLSARQIPFMLIGGQAVLLHGRPRLTEDIGLTLGVGPDAWRTVREICGELQLEPLTADLESFVRETFVLPARHEPTALRVDFIFSTTPYERQAIARAVTVEIAGVPVPFATAENLIIHKLFAGRPRDIEDAVGVIRRNRGRIAWEYIERWIAQFAAIPGRAALPLLLATTRRGGERE